MFFWPFLGYLISTALAKGPKFGRQPATDDVISKYDAARSCFGKQVLHKNRSAPAVGFNHDTRDMRSKTKAEGSPWIPWGIRRDG